MGRADRASHVFSTDPVETKSQVDETNLRMQLTSPPDIEDLDVESPASVDVPSTSAHFRSQQQTVPRSNAWKLFLTGLVCMALGIGGGWWIALQQMHENSKIALEPSNEARASDVIPINVDKVSYRNVRRQIDAIGSVLALEDLTIASKSTGRILKLHADLADRIEPGSLLLEIDPTDSQLAVAQSEQSLEAERVRWGIKDMPAKQVDISTLPPVVTARLRADLAKSKFSRFESLLRTNSISQDDFDQVRSDYLVAQSEWENQSLMARAALASIVLREADLNVNRQRLVDTKVYAPVPSVELRAKDRFYSIAQRMVSEGTMVRPGDNLFRLVLGQSVKVSLRLQERYSQMVMSGQEVEIEVSSASEPARGVIQRVSPVVDPLTRTFVAEVGVANDGLQLKPGGFVKARILIGKEETVPTVPVIALDTFAGLNKVFTIESGIATEHQVQIGMQNEDWVEIAEPKLPESALVATSAQRMLSDGVSVSVKNEADAKSGDVKDKETAIPRQSDAAQ
jgi:RND family efflux transporter MFP subunit